jgi:hypothetical protein
MRTITLEEHFVTTSFLRATGAYGSSAPPQLAELQPKLLDLGAGRIADMDEAAIDVQVLSLAAMGFDALDAATAAPVARDVNDELRRGSEPPQSLCRLCHAGPQGSQLGSHRT